MSKLTKFVRSWWLRSRIQYTDTPLAEYARGLAANEPWSFTRFGDGEWYAIFEDPGANADGHAYFPELGRDLRRTLESSLPYRYGMQPSVMGLDGIRIANYLARAHVTVPWHNANVFHYANRDGLLYPLVRELRKKPVVFIGPAHLRAIDGVVFPIEHFIEIPVLNCYLNMDETREQVRAHASAHKGVVYAFAASMMTNVIVHDLFPEFGSTHWMIDCGSVFDVYVGVRSRSVYHKQDWAPIIERNLKG